MINFKKNNFLNWNKFDHCLNSSIVANSEIGYFFKFEIFGDEGQNFKQQNFRMTDFRIWKLRKLKKIDKFVDFPNCKIPKTSEISKICRTIKIPKTSNLVNYFSYMEFKKNVKIKNKSKNRIIRLSLLLYSKFRNSEISAVPNDDPHPPHSNVFGHSNDLACMLLKS